MDIQTPVRNKELEYIKLITKLSTYPELRKLFLEGPDAKINRANIAYFVDIFGEGIDTFEEYKGKILESAEKDNLSDFCNNVVQILSKGIERDTNMSKGLRDILCAKALLMGDMHNLSGLSDINVTVEKYYPAWFAESDIF